MDRFQCCLLYLPKIFQPLRHNSFHRDVQSSLKMCISGGKKQWTNTITYIHLFNCWWWQSQIKKYWILNVAKFAPLLSPFLRKILRQLKPHTVQSQSKFDPVWVMQLKSRPAGNTAPLLLVFSLWKFTAIFVIISSHIAALMEFVIMLWEKNMPNF